MLVDFMKKTPFVLFSAILIFSMCSSAKKNESSRKDNVFRKLAVKLSAADSRMKTKTAAVYGFSMIGRGGDSYTRYATEKLTHELVDIGRLNIIERSRIDEVLKEQQFSSTGLVDAATAARIGKILSVEAVIIGTITITNNEVEYIARIIQSENAMIIASANERYTAETIARIDTSGNSKDNSGGSVKIIDKVDNAVSTVEVVIKNVYLRSERITINYSGMPGSAYDWITLVAANQPDNTYNEWFYTNGQTSGSYTFNPVGPGKYEVRIYYDWPHGGYIVQKRIPVSVK